MQAKTEVGYGHWRCTAKLSCGQKQTAFLHVRMGSSHAFACDLVTEYATIPGGLDVLIQLTGFLLRFH